MHQWHNFVDDLKDEMKKFSIHEVISQNETSQSVYRLREICRKHARPEADIIIAAFESDDFKKAVTWDYIFAILNLLDDKLYILSAITMVLKSSNLYDSLKLESPLCFYYANIVLWKYGESALSLRDPEGVNARLLSLDAFLKFGMDEFCLGITEDLLRICAHADDRTYQDILNVLNNNLEIIHKVSRSDRVDLVRNAEDLLSLIS